MSLNLVAFSINPTLQVQTLCLRLINAFGLSSAFEIKPNVAFLNAITCTSVEWTKSKHEATANE